MRASREEIENRLIAEQAAQWLCDLREANEAQEHTLLAWLKQSPRHIKEYLFAETVWQEVRQTPFAQLDVDKLIAEARADRTQANVVPLTENGSDPLADLQSAGRISVPRSVRYRWMSVAAGLAFIAVGAVIASWWLLRTPTYSTAVGEQRSLQLDDGSWMHLNTHSRVEVRYSAQSRELRLVEGEALFTVQQDAARPFVVHAGEAVIRALGTQFNVYRRAEDTMVAVISGAVSVTPADASEVLSAARTPTRLDAGQKVQIAKSGKVSRAQPDVADAVAWRERRLVFRGETLAAVAAEFNRYNEQPIRVDGEMARRKLLSGTFDADDPSSLLLFLRKLDDLVVEDNNNGLVIRSR